MTTPTKTVTLWFSGGNTWSFTCTLAEANDFVSAASNYLNNEQGTQGYSAGIYSTLSAPGRFICWNQLTDFLIQ